MAILETILIALQNTLVAGGFRNLIGYTRVSLEDGRISKYEWRMLGIKFTEALLYTTALSLLGAEAATAVGGSVLMSVIRSTIEKAASR